ncbi:MAG TPA: response regulator transcription factor [Candidatus Limnocylindrales bacterium]|nr:response regulator transcription factor [Candidatus Limnocylindrales bacterium]
MTASAGEPRGTTVLVVDDEPAMVGALGALLGQAGHRIVAAYDGEEALRRFRESPIDVVLLDLAMPGVDGAEVCRRLRATSDVPIIVVSGERDRGAPVELLDLGADDYVRKPFRGDELLARVRAALRRRGATGESADRSTGWELDLRRHEIRWQAQALPLTPIEFRLLRALLERRGELVRHAELLAAGWPGTPDPDPLWMKPHLARLRDKLASAGARQPVAVRGVGYRLED